MSIENRLFTTVRRLGHRRARGRDIEALTCVPVVQVEGVRLLVEVAVRQRRQHALDRRPDLAELDIRLRPDRDGRDRLPRRLDLGRRRLAVGRLVPGADVEGRGQACGVEEEDGGAAAQVDDGDDVAGLHAAGEAVLVLEEHPVAGAGPLLGRGLEGPRRDPRGLLGHAALDLLCGGGGGGGLLGPAFEVRAIVTCAARRKAMDAVADEVDIVAVSQGGKVSFVSTWWTYQKLVVYRDPLLPGLDVLEGICKTGKTGERGDDEVEETHGDCL